MSVSPVCTTQPAQSPDFNICDLALFRALKCAVRKVRRSPAAEGEISRFDVEQLVRDVTKVAMSHPAEQLTNMWDFKSDIMEKVVGASLTGRNTRVGPSQLSVQFKNLSQGGTVQESDQITKVFFHQIFDVVVEIRDTGITILS